MNKLTILSGVAVAALVGGCVPSEKYTALKLQARANEEAMRSAQADAAMARGQYEALQSRLGTTDAAGSDMRSQLSLAIERSSSLQKELDALNSKYAEAMSRAGSTGALPVPLTNELRTFAQQNPDLVDFDERRGTVKFKSDVTFDVGDATLKPKAKEALQKFAAILTSPAASGYELLVAGHTDKTPVSNPETIRRGHKDNWYLSAHRAISVAEALVGQSVAATRMGVVGYADQRPISSNDALNRRVEVLILPTQVASRPPVSSDGGGDASAKPKPSKSDNKDPAMSVPPRESTPPASSDNK